MPLPTCEQLVEISTKIALFSSKLETYTKLAENSIGEVAEAYKVIANHYEWKIRNAINSMWLYMNESINEMPPILE